MPMPTPMQMWASWYLTWQDPAALLLAAGGLWLALRLRSRLPTHCAGCPQTGSQSSPQTAQSEPLTGDGPPRQSPLIPASQLLRKLR